MEREFTPGEWEESDLRKLAHHEAAHAVISWKLGVRCELEIESIPGHGEDREFLHGVCTRILTFTPEGQQRLKHAYAVCESKGEAIPIPLGDEDYIELSDREIAAVCIAGRVAEWMLSEDGEYAAAGDVLDSLEYDPLSDSDRKGIVEAFPEVFDSPGIVDMVEETSRMLHDSWDMVQGLADHLAKLFSEDGHAFVTAAEFAEFMDSLPDRE